MHIHNVDVDALSKTMVLLCFTRRVFSHLQIWSIDNFKWYQLCLRFRAQWIRKGTSHSEFVPLSICAMLISFSRALDNTPIGPMGPFRTHQKGGTLLIRRYYIPARAQDSVAVLLDLFCMGLLECFFGWSIWGVWSLLGRYQIPQFLHKIGHGSPFLQHDRCWPWGLGFGHLGSSFCVEPELDMPAKNICRPRFCTVFMAFPLTGQSAAGTHNNPASHNPLQIPGTVKWSVER